MVENQTGRIIKKLRSDNGGEYKFDQFLKVCQEEEIVRNFRVKAINYAVHLVNQLPNIANGGKTPLCMVR